MNLRIFQKFDPWGMNRLVWDKPETPPAPAAGPPTTQRTAEEAAAARAAMEKQRAGAAAAAQRTDRAGEQADAALDTALGGGGAASGQTPAAPAETPEQNETLPSFAEIIKILTENHPDESGAVRAETEPAKIEQKLKVLFAALTPEEKETFERLDAALLAVTPEEQANFKNTYKKGDGNALDLAIIGEKLKAKQFTIKEYLIFLSLVGDAEIDELVKQNVFSTADAIYWKDFLTSVKVKIETKRKLDHFNALVTDKKYAEAYRKFLDGMANPGEKPLKEIKQEFLASFQGEEQKIVEWGINSEPSAFEKTYVLKNKLKGTKLTDEQIQTQLSKGTLNFREAQIALALNHERTPEGEGSEIPDSIKGLGIMGAIEKLIELLTKLANKISGAIDRMIKKNGPETQKKGFAKSPLGTDEKGGDKKFKLKRGYEAGKGVAIEAAPQAQIFAVEGGAVKVDGNVITVTPPQSNVRIEYRNVKVAAGVAGQTVEAGKPIGTAGEGGTVELRAFVNNEEQDTSELLKPYIQEEAAPAVAETPPATPPATTPPTAPATNPPNAPAQPPAAPAAVPAAKAEAAPAAGKAPEKTWRNVWGLFS